MSDPTKYLSGQGKVYAALRDGSGIAQGYFTLGNSASLVLNLGTAGERFAINGSGTVPALSMGGENPSIEFEIHEFDKTNLEKVLYGQQNSSFASLITNEVITARLGAMVPLSKIGITTFTSLTHTSGTPTYVNGTDYTVNLATGSINFPASGSAITEGQSLKANFSYGAQEKNSAFTMAPYFYALRVEGVNTVTQKPFVLDVYKVRLMPADSLPIIGDDIFSMKVRAMVLYDSQRTDTTADGRFFRLIQGR